MRLTENAIILNPRTIGERVHNARRLAGMSQRDVSFKTGYDVATIRRIEGDKNVSLFTFVEVCKVIGASLDYVVYGEENNDG